MWCLAQSNWLYSQTTWGIQRRKIIQLSNDGIGYRMMPFIVNFFYFCNPCMENLSYIFKFRNECSQLLYLTVNCWQLLKCFSRTRFKHFIYCVGGILWWPFGVNSKISPNVAFQDCFKWIWLEPDGYFKFELISLSFFVC